MTDNILIAHHAGIMSVTLNRPERKNAINEDMMSAMAAAFEQAAPDSTVRAVVIRAMGKDFSAGGDIKDVASILEQTPQQRSDEFRAMVRRDAARLSLAMHHTPQPILLSVRGHVIGMAVQMAAIADLVIASATARFAIPQVNLAHTVDHGESWHLPRKIGVAKANQMCLMADALTADLAERAGLVNWVVPDDELDIRTDSIAKRLASSPPVALQGMKTLLRQSETSSFETQLDSEIQMIGCAVATEDFVEALKGFIEKRPPVFTGR